MLGGRKMFDYINSVLEQTMQWVEIPYFSPIDLFEIIILSIQIYLLSKSLLDTRMWSIVKGMLYLLVVYGVFMILNMRVLAQVFIFIIALALIGIVLALQPDIKKMLESAGGKNYIKELIKLLKKKDSNNLIFQNTTIDQIVDACEDMQETKTGALIVIEVDTPLDSITTTGVKIDAVVQKPMIIQSFVKNTPLHDGAMVIKGNRIDSATCYLPLTSSSKISKDLGTRHRAGIGVTEEVNCFVVIVSEETGQISWAENGKLKHKVQTKELKQKLIDIQHSKDRTYKKNIKKDQNKKYGSKLKDRLKYIALDRVGHNLNSKVLQCLCGVLLWLAVINLINPTTTRRIQDIPVTIVNSDAITDTDKTYDVVQGDTVQVIVKGRRSIVDSLDKEQIKAEADFNNLSITNSVPITVELPEQYQDNLQVSYQSTSNMRIEVDDIAEVTLNVEPNIIGKTQENTFVSNVETNVEQVKVSGPSRLIQTIDKVAIDVNVEGASKDFQTTVKPVVYDKNGQIISTDRVNINVESVQADVKILETKTVSLNVNLVNNDKNTRIDGYELSNNTVQLAGTIEQLEKIDELNIEVDATNTLLSAEQSKVIQVVDLNNYLDSDVQVYGDSKINIQMQITKAEQKVIDINSSEIDLINENSKYSYNVTSQNIGVTVEDYQDKLKDIGKDKIKLTVDVAGYKPGEYDIQPENIKIQYDGLNAEIPKDLLLQLEVDKK